MPPTTLDRLAAGRAVVVGLQAAQAASAVRESVLPSPDGVGLDGSVVLRARRLVEAPLEDVWALTADIPRTPEWVVFSKEIRECSQDVAGLGVSYTDRVRSVGPLTTVTHWRIVEFDPPKRRVHVGKVPFVSRFAVTIEMSSIGARATCVDYTYRYRPALRPLGSIISRLTTHATRIGMQRSLDRLAALVAAP